MRFRGDGARLSLKWALLIVLLLAGLVVTSCTRTALARGWSGGTVSGDSLYFGSMDGRLAAVNVADGTEEWAVPLETGRVSTGLGCSSAPIVVSIYGSPAVSDNLVYVGGYNGKVYAFSPGKSEPRWVYPRQGSLAGQIVGALTADGGDIYFGASDGSVYSLDAAEGFSNWTFKTGGKVWSTPAVSNGTVYIGSFDRKLYALNAADGTKKWTFTAQGAIESAPVVEGNTVYVGSNDRYMYALDAVSGQLKWKFQARNFFWAEPIVRGDSIYAPSLDGHVYVLKADTGQRVAEINVGAEVSSSPIVAGDSVIVAGEDGVVWKIDSSDKGQVLAKINETVHAALGGNQSTVFVHTDRDILYGVDVATGALRTFTVK